MRLRAAATGALSAFALNWAWENAQAFLYKDYAGFAQHVWGCTIATFGDVAIVAAIWAAVAVLWRDIDWHRRAGAGQYLAAILIGVAVAFAIEYWALASGRWAYAGMPLVPYTGIGLAPILQMVVPPPIVFRIMGIAGRERRRGAGA